MAQQINAAHAEHAKYAAQWRRCRDAVEGEDAIHAAGEAYLPRLTDQTDDRYAAYVARAPLYNAVGRTVDGLTGLVFRKAPTVVKPAKFDADDVDGDGTPLGSWCEQVMEELIVCGRVGLLVDMPAAPDGAVTRGELETAGVRPFVRTYTAETIVNWERGLVGGKNRLVRVVLAESSGAVIDQYRELVLVDGAYVQRVHRRNEAGEWAVVAELVPSMGGKPLPYLPFVLIGARGIESRTSKPPLIDLVNVNLSHYRAHIGGIPTMVITGHHAEEGEALAIGCDRALVFGEPDARVQFLEYSGQGLDALFKLLDRKEQQMATLGARILSQDKAAAESGVAQAIKRGGENSVLASLARAASEGITRALSLLCEWGAVPGDVSVSLNTDYLPEGMSAQELTALVQAWQAGAISHETLFHNLKAGELVADGVDFETESDRIATTTPRGVV